MSLCKSKEKHVVNFQRALGWLALRIWHCSRVAESLP